MFGLGDVAWGEASRWWVDCWGAAEWGGSGGCLTRGVEVVSAVVVVGVILAAWLGPRSPGFEGIGFTVHIATRHTSKERRIPQTNAKHEYL
ncbi:hypothetical protein [Pseudovibrio sp. FO-BEG1]|uniref:hypothetical protein n=1 Tax=Pseudovibrio sp. (strain FO-BEG1) TaxID=911045 RepID=UPI0011D2457D|nr:hypothetical protein [Pseudovibrio sp. FO-BEG1]